MKINCVYYLLFLVAFPGHGAEAVTLSRDPVGINLSSKDLRTLKFLAVVVAEIDNDGMPKVKKLLPVIGEGKFSSIDIEQNASFRIEQMETFYEKRKLTMLIYVAELRGKDAWDSNEARVLPAETLQTLLLKKAGNEEIKSDEKGALERYLAREKFRSALKARGWNVSIEQSILDQYYDTNTTDLEKICLLDMITKYISRISDFKIIQTILDTAKLDDAVNMRIAYIMLLLAIIKDEKYSKNIDDAFLKIIKEHCSWWNDKSFKSASFGDRAIFFSRSYMLLHDVSQKYKAFYKQ